MLDSVVEDFEKSNNYMNKNFDETLKRILDSDLLITLSHKKLELMESFHETMNNSMNSGNSSEFEEDNKKEDNNKKK